MFNWIKEENHFFAWIPTLMWGTMILFFSILPYHLNPPLTVGYFDKMVHFFEYAVLGVLVGKGLYSTGKRFSAGNIVLILIITSGYGILMELVQSFVPGRCPSPGDVLANIAGVVFGIVLGKVVLWQK